MNTNSNPLFDECEIAPGKPYKKGGWKDIVINDENNVRGFFGEYRFLSNFWSCTVYYDGFRFPTSEHAYMFAKLDLSVMSESDILSLYESVSKMKAKEVKKWGQTIKLRPDWENVKYDIMARIVFDKFSRNLELREKLLSTGNKYLEETNWWNDQYWGYDYRKGGQNNLGKILMKVRDFLKK